MSAILALKRFLSASLHGILLLPVGARLAAQDFVHLTLPAGHAGAVPAASKRNQALNQLRKSDGRHGLPAGDGRVVLASTVAADGARDHVAGGEADDLL